MNILHIDSSILGANSLTRPLSALTVERLVAANPGARVEHRDLGENPIPHLTGADFAARGQAVDPVLEQFKAADIIVIGSPMYNWTISSQLKAWIDRVAVAGETFAYTPQGPKGLAGGKQVIVDHRPRQLDARRTLRRLRPSGAVSCGPSSASSASTT